MKIDNVSENPTADLKSNKPSGTDKPANAKFQALLAKQPSGPKSGDRHSKADLLERPAKQSKPLPSQKDEEQAVANTGTNDLLRHQPFRPVEIEKVEAPRPAAPAAIVEGLVREISVITTDEKQEVQIQFDSRTLDGLQIQISKEDGNVSLRFVTSSSEVERLLQRNMEQLTNGLSQRGVNVTSNRVERVSEPPAQKQSGRQGGRQQRR